MEQRGRGHGRPRRKENVEDVNDLTEMMRTMMATRDEKGDEEELETIK